MSQLYIVTPNKSNFLQISGRESFLIYDIFLDFFQQYSSLHLKFLLSFCKVFFHKNTNLWGNYFFYCIIKTKSKLKEQTVNITKILSFPYKSIKYR